MSRRATENLKEVVMDGKTNTENKRCNWVTGYKVLDADFGERLKTGSRHQYQVGKLYEENEFCQDNGGNTYFHTRLFNMLKLGLIGPLSHDLRPARYAEVMTDNMQQSLISCDTNRLYIKNEFFPDDIFNMILDEIQPPPGFDVNSDSRQILDWNIRSSCLFNGLDGSCIFMPQERYCQGITNVVWNRSNNTTIICNGSADRIVCFGNNCVVQVSGLRPSVYCHGIGNRVIVTGMEAEVYVSGEKNIVKMYDNRARVRMNAPGSCLFLEAPDATFIADSDCLVRIKLQEFGTYSDFSALNGFKFSTWYSRRGVHIREVKDAG